MEGELGQLLPDSFKLAENENKNPICNFVEFSGQSNKEVQDQAESMIKAVSNETKIIAIHHVQDSTDQSTFWNARKAAVGLLANCPPGPQPAAFVEDCVVPLRTCLIF